MHLDRYGLNFAEDSYIPVFFGGRSGVVIGLTSNLGLDWISLALLGFTSMVGIGGLGGLYVGAV